MKKLINYFFYNPLTNRFPVLREMSKFALVGVSNTIIDFSIYFCLTRVFSFWQEYYLAANLIAFSAAATWSFFINKHWTFKYKGSDTRKQYFQFFLVVFLGLLLTEAILYLSVDVFKQSDILGKVSAVFIVYFWNFFINKFWTFRKRPTQSNDEA